VLVQDNLNTHTPASRYAGFAPAEAKRLADRLEIHDTPKHGSWLNIGSETGGCAHGGTPHTAVLKCRVFGRDPTG
jgi:hypothetical protein